MFDFLLGRKVTVYVPCKASEESPIKKKNWTITKTVRFRELPRMGETIHISGLDGANTVGEVKHITGPFCKETFIELASAVLPYQAEHMCQNGGWKKL